MNKRLAFIQFVKDGLVGLAAAGLIYGAIALAAFFLFYDSLFSTLRLISTLMFPLCLMMFISVGINGRFVENNATRKDWGKSILKMVGVAWFFTVLISITDFLGFATINRVSIAYPDHNFDSISKALSVYWDTFHEIVYELFPKPPIEPYPIYALIGSAIVSILLAFVITYLIAIIANPQKRLEKLFLPVITNISILIGIPLGSYLGFILSILIYGFELGLHRIWSAL